MTNKEFDTLVSEQIKLIERTLYSKGVEYQNDSNIDRLHQLKAMQSMVDLDAKTMIMVLLSKHLVSILDKGESYSKEVLDEKFTDIINYMILMKAFLVEKK